MAPQSLSGCANCLTTGIGVEEEEEDEVGEEVGREVAGEEVTVEEGNVAVEDRVEL